METYFIIVGGFGVLVLLTAWLPLALRSLPLSLPICCVGIGALLATIPSVAALVPTPDRNPSMLEHATEIVVVASLVGAGLKINRPFSLLGWSMAWRMVGIAMPAIIAALTVLAMYVLDLHAAAALLLASSLAPTDPVLASDVQVGSPSDEARFALTAEAGLNDGMAFPLCQTRASSCRERFTRRASVFAPVRHRRRVEGRQRSRARRGDRSRGGLAHISHPQREGPARTGDGFVALAGC